MTARTAAWQSLRRIVHTARSDMWTPPSAIDAATDRLYAEVQADTPPVALEPGDQPTPLRWGLNDVECGDDGTVTVLLAGPDREPYTLELDPSRAAALREALAGPDGGQ